MAGRLAVSGIWVPPHVDLLATFYLYYAKSGSKFHLPDKTLTLREDSTFGVLSFILLSTGHYALNLGVVHEPRGPSREVRAKAFFSAFQTLSSCLDIFINFKVVNHHMQFSSSCSSGSPWPWHREFSNAGDKTSKTMGLLMYASQGGDISLQALVWECWLSENAHLAWTESSDLELCGFSASHKPHLLSF